ncbi:MAG: RNA polymerase sigma factor [Acidimicrobiia bacterium]|nr:RNA polymerase sigma factor [Acidimicrobiia bacterium]
MALRADDVDLERDAALVERFQTGDEAAFADLYQRYFARLRRYCQRRLNDPHDAEEAAQEALVKAYKALPNFGGDRHFYPWLRVIATNVCNDRCKRKPVAAPADPDGGDVVVDSVFDALDQAFVRAALRDLNPRHRAALSLWAEGHPSRHIAEELGCSTGAVDVTLHRARQSFKARFLALSGEGKLGVLGVGLVPALGRFADRWRARIVTRVGEHSDLASPLVAKLAAGAIAFTVIGGAVATSSTPHPVSPTAPPTSIVHVQTSPVSAVSTIPTPSTTAATAEAPTTTAASHTATLPSAKPKADPRSNDIAPQLMSSDQAQARGEKAPIRVEVPGVAGFAVDPSSVTNILRPKEHP